MKKSNILITGISSSNSLTFLKSLRQQKEIEFNLFGTDIYEKHLSVGAQFCDRFFKIPRADEKQFIPTLLKICQENAIQILVPIIDEEFLSISKSINQFKEIKTQVMLPKAEVVKISQDKVKFCQFLKDNGFLTPKWYLSKPSVASLPLIKKPFIGRGSRGIIVMHTQEELNYFWEETGFFYQQYIEGREFTIDTLSNLNGKVLAAVPRIRLEVREGKSIKAQIVKNKLIEEMAIKICQKLGITGPACLQCILGKDGRPYFFEINPRIGSATILTVAAGINIPFLAVKILLGMKIDNLVGQFKKNVIMLRYLNEVFTTNSQ